jgi:hypothetical protein
MKLLIKKRREFNLETNFAFVDYEMAFDRVKHQKLFYILKEKNIPNLLLKNIFETYTNNTIRIKISNNTTEESVINQGVTQGCPLSPTLYIYTHTHTQIHTDTYIYIHTHKVAPIRSQNGKQAPKTTSELSSKRNMTTWKTT